MGAFSSSTSRQEVLPDQDQSDRVITSTPPTSLGTTASRVGKLLRRTKIDELRQLANVLLGHMNAVDPRPPLPSQVVTHIGAVQHRLPVEPGLTGLRQVSGRSDHSWDKSVQLDLLHVGN